MKRQARFLKIASTLVCTAFLFSCSNQSDSQIEKNVAIFVKNAKRTIISLPEGTDNYVSDGKKYNVSDDEPNSAIFSKDDLTINGTGKLSVQGNYNNGITSKDNLIITGGSDGMKAAIKMEQKLFNFL